MSNKPLITLSLALTFLVGLNYLNAWTAPAAVPPNGNVSAPVHVGDTDQLKSGGLGVGTLGVFGESYFADVIKATSSVWAAAFCDRTGANCLVPGATTEVSETSGGSGGNELVYLAAPQVLYPASMFTGTSNISRTYNFVAGGYPANIVRAYITSYGEGSPTRTYDCGNNTCSTPGVPAVLSYYAPFETVASIIITHSASTLRRQGEWIDVRNSQADFVARCGSSDCSINIELAGYECAGACVYTSIELCTVNFNYTIRDTSGSKSREIIGGGGQMGIGLWNHHDDNISHQLPFTEQLYSKSWGASTFDSSEKAGVGFFDKNQYSRHLTLLQTRDAAANYEVAPLTLTVGSTATISNDASKDIPAGTATITATVASCRTIGG